jgi:hypothetical protein
LTRKNTGHSPQSKHQIVNDVMHKLVLEVKDVEVEGKGSDSPVLLQSQESNPGDHEVKDQEFGDPQITSDSENIQFEVETRRDEALDEVVQRDRLGITK